MTKNQKSELLLPVGNMNMCLAAIHNGADAIYVGVPTFNARGRSADLSVIELKEMIDLCHLYGVKVNLAFNIVLFEEELPKAIDLLQEILPLAPDAFIVQDLGLARIIRQMSPSQIIHGSTQMTVTNFEAMNLLQDLAIKRFVLGREVSISEMRSIKKETECELEVFVHGALCVAYSGQCYTSESIGGRSANRGQCAQSCRFEYDLIVDGEKKDLGGKKYLVSPKDLCGIAQIPELVELKINSFKVEGRLKTPEYVASAASHYREAIDRSLTVKQYSEAQKEMGLTYSRGFFTGWLNGVNHQELVDGTYGAHRGVAIGRVIGVFAKSIKIIARDHLLKKGDGILLASSVLGKKSEVGGILYEVRQGSKAHEWELFFARNFDISQIKMDFIVYLNHDAQIEKKLTQSYTNKNFKKRIPLTIKVKAVLGKSLELIVSDGEHVVSLMSENTIEEAIDRPTRVEDLKEELGALSATCFSLSHLELETNEAFFIHQKELKNLRRIFTEKLMQLRVYREKIDLLPTAKLFQKKECFNHSQPKLNLLLREFIQVKEFLSYVDLIKDVLGIVYLDYEFGKDYAPSVQLLKEAKVKVGIATTRILKPNEYHNFMQIKRAAPDVILCRNLGAIYYFQNDSFELRGDFSLNVTNSLSAAYFLTKNLKSVCVSYDLNANQVSELLNKMDSGTIEVTIHQYMPSFHMEHCVFAAYLSKGTSFKDCGKPCEKHRVELKDQFGHFHQIKADQECRNTMFNATSQSAIKEIAMWKKLGLSEFRVEALYEKGDELKDKILSYARLMQEECSSEVIEALIAKLGLLEKYGLSDRSYDHRKYKNKKVRK